jgi:sugar phosphate isomerase/epimerase
MKLALNTLVYEVGNKGPEESLRAAVKFGFKYIEYAGIRKGNPLTMSSKQRDEANWGLVRNNHGYTCWRMSDVLLSGDWIKISL